VRRGRPIVGFLAVLLVAAAASGSAFAAGRGRGGGGHSGSHSGAHSGHGGTHHHHRFSTGVFIGAPLFYFPRAYYYPAPYSYDPPPAPSYYVEQPQLGYWHYCPSAGAYYPQVQTCPEGWQLVPPQPRSGY
jgi:hypothetical protein